MSKNPTQTGAKSGIYALLDGDVIKYVGQSKNIKKRYAQHCSIMQCRSNRDVHKWIRQLIETGRTPSLQILEITDALDEREIYWIAKLRDEGTVLLNMAAGGKDMSHLKRAKKNMPWGNKWSPVQRRLIEIRQCEKSILKYGAEDKTIVTNQFAKRMARLNERIKSVGLDKVNMLLWEKYGY